MLLVHKKFTEGVMAAIKQDEAGHPCGIILDINKAESLEEFVALLNGYLNTRPEAPRWMFDLVDALQQMPGRHDQRHQVDLFTQGANL